MDAHGMSLSELLADEELMHMVGALDCGYSEHVFGIVSNVASFAEIRKGLVSFPLINNILAKILREGSSLAKCNAAMAIKGMALDAGFRADCLACVAPSLSVFCNIGRRIFPQCFFVTSGAGTAWQSI